MYWSVKHNNLLKIFILYIIIITGCAPSPEAVQPAFSFFSLQDYFQNEITSLEEKQPQVSKEVILNQEVEKLQVSDLNWEQELSFFLESDINKRALMESYKVDTIRHDKSLEVHYKATEDKLAVQTIDLSFPPNSNAPSSIKIHRRSNNMFYESDMKLSYQQGSYSIDSYNKTLLTSPTNLSISCNW